MYASTDFSNAVKIRTLPKNEEIRILGELAKGYRIRLSDGTKGYIPTIGFELINQEVQNRRSDTK